jgi:hypothetical protein
MLVRYYVELPFEADAVEAALSREPRAWLPEVVRASNRRGLEMILRVGLNVARQRVDHAVIVTVSNPQRIGDTCMIPMSWRPTSEQALLPSLEGDLEISTLTDDTCQLAISASYRPPLGWAGALSDRALMRRVAELTVKDFLDRVATGVATMITARATFARAAAI